MNENKKYILLDFDDVLFNAKKFRKDIILLFSQFGISRDIFYKTYKDFPVKHRNGIVESYDPEKQFKKIEEKFGMDIDKLKKEFYDLVFGSGKYIFRDVKEFLEKFKEEDIFVVSYGKNELQSLKIKYSGLADYFQKVVILNETKEKAIPILLGEKYLETKEIYFFDDRTMFLDEVKKKYPTIKTFLVKRKEGRYHDDKTSYCDYEISDLKQAQKIIQNS